MSSKMIIFILILLMNTIYSIPNDFNFWPNNIYCNKQLKAIGNGNLTLVEKLSDSCDPNEYILGQTQLGFAALKSMERSRRWNDLIGIPNPLIPIIKFLLFKGADPCKLNYKNETAYEHYINYVVWYPNPEIKELLDVCNSLI